MKAVIIARVSTEEQRESGNSLPAQIARLERYCQSKGFTIIKSCSFDESAYSDQRKEFDLIVDFILEQKEKIAVCCDKVDRLSRNAFDKRISKLYQKALDDKLEIHFASDGQIITSKIGAVEKFQFGMSLGLAGYYSDTIRDNVKRAREQILRNGSLPGKAVFGYKNIQNNGKPDIAVSEYEASIVKMIYTWYVSGVFSLDSIREKLKKEYGLKWSRGRVYKTLIHPFYYGEMVNKGVKYPHRYEPIIPRTLWDQAQEQRIKAAKKPFKLVSKPYMYRGLMKCDECGMAITAEKQKGHVYYHCTEYAGKHGAAWIREEVLTEQFEQFFKRLQVPENIRKQIIDGLNKTHEQKVEFHNQQQKELNKEHSMLTTMMDNLFMEKLKGRVNDGDYDRFYQKFRDQLDDVNNRIAKLQDAEDNYYIAVKYILEITEKGYEIFQSSEVDQKRQLIGLLLSNLRAKDRKVLYDVQKPFDLILKASDCLLWCAREGSNL